MLPDLLFLRLLDFLCEIYFCWWFFFFLYISLVLFCLARLFLFYVWLMLFLSAFCFTLHFTCLNSDGQQFHQYQHNEQSPLTQTRQTQKGGVDISFQFVSVVFPLAGMLVYLFWYHKSEGSVSNIQTLILFISFCFFLWTVFILHPYCFLYDILVYLFEFKLKSCVSYL